jgi:alkylation response protein AidB-like acyl-CoA dehydrogenase
MEILSLEKPQFMTFEETENQKMIAQMIRDFGSREIKPYMMDWDESQEFPIDLFHEMGKLGLLGVLVPEEYGGAGFGYLEYITAIVELSKIDGAIGLSMAAHNSLCTNHILQFASDEQKRKYLPKLATGEWIGAWGLTEPNTGSDAGNMRTVAIKDGDYFVLNGSKNFITHGKSGHVAVVIARTGQVGDSHGMTAFIVERGTPGFGAGKKENKL